MKKWLLPSLALFLTACNPVPSIEKIADAERQKIARGYIERLIAGDVTGLATEVEPASRKVETPQVFEQMRAPLPRGAPTVVNLVGYGLNRGPKEVNYTLSYQYGYRDKWFLIIVAWREKTGAPREITGLRVTAMDRSLQEATAFTLARARPRHYAFLAGLILVPTFILVSLVACIRMKALPRKWIWIILILVGVVKFSLNWTSGALIILPVAIQLFGFSVVAANTYAPWIVSVSMPLGAIAFWFRRRQLARATGSAKLAPGEATASNGHQESKN